MLGFVLDTYTDFIKTMLGFEFETYQDLVKQNNAMNLI